MKIAVLSGKGGTGKTFVSVNLAASANQTTYVDCDVEEPNGHLFFKPENIIKEDVYVKLPEFDMEKCDGCRKCVDFCQFNALALIGNKMLVFNEICHSCGGCSLICPNDAVIEVDKCIGHIEVGNSQDTKVITGLMNVGEASGVPIINRLNQEIQFQDQDVYIDCPPGSACVVMESIKEADYCIIAAEPSAYGVHNMAMVVELVQKFDKPLGVVINKSIDHHHPVKEFCKSKNLTIIGEIPYDESLASMNSKGLIAVREDPDYKILFSNIYKRVQKEASDETASNS